MLANPLQLELRACIKSMNLKKTTPNALMEFLKRYRESKFVTDKRTQRFIIGAELTDLRFASLRSKKIGLSREFIRVTAR